MLHTEYVRSLNCNYERILLDKKPEERRYQYCILTRGGIKGLLSCSLRYIDGAAYLYYDISSRQNVAQLYGNRCISRAWVVDFLWSMRQIKQELERFLLDSSNVLWQPEHIFQDLESNVFSFLYVPYYEGEPGFLKLMEFFIDHIDYEDEGLVECVYSMYEQLERNGEVYLQAQIYEDAKILETHKLTAEETVAAAATETAAAGSETIYKAAQGNETGRNAFGESAAMRAAAAKAAAMKAPAEGAAAAKAAAVKVPAEGMTAVKNAAVDAADREEAARGTARYVQEEAAKAGYDKRKAVGKELSAEVAETEKTARKRSAREETERGEKRGIRSIFEGKRKRGREQREDYRLSMQREMAGYAVAEEPIYEEESYGRTVFMEEKAADISRPHRLLAADGRLLAVLDKPVFSIGKKKEDADMVLDNPSVSRIHARIVQEKTEVYLEDLNSTNGTFKNGLRLQPYEKRKLEEGDEIKCGTFVMIFR